MNSRERAGRDRLSLQSESAAFSLVASIGLFIVNVLLWGDGRRRNCLISVSLSSPTVSVCLSVPILNLLGKTFIRHFTLCWQSLWYSVHY